MNDLESQLDAHINKALAHLEEELKKIRGGRANAGMLDSLRVEVYGQMQPLNHVARVLATDARSLSVTPYDPSSLASIAKAIREDQSLGLNPVDDGKVIRLTIPEMTQERREQIAKLVQSKAEDSRIALRNARHEVLEAGKTQQKIGEMSEDDFKRFDKAVTEKLEAAQQKIDTQIKAKEVEILTV